MTAGRWAVLALLLVCGGVRAETFALISDINGRYGSTAYAGRVHDAVALIARVDPVAVLTPGDLVAGQKQPKLDSAWLDSMWRAFDDAVARPLAHADIALLPSPGNHDGSAFPEFELERQRYRHYWSTRRPENELLAGSDWPRHYALRIGETLLIAFDGSRPGPLPPAERDFVARTLTEYGAQAPCTLVMGHLPMWPLARHREREIIDDPDLLDLLHRHGVDAYISGHHHVFYPGVDEAGMLHLAVGALGGNARSFSGHLVRESHSFAFLIHADGVLRVMGLEAPDFARHIEPDSLPERVHGPLGTLQRLSGDLLLRH